MCFYFLFLSLLLVGAYRYFLFLWAKTTIEKYRGPPLLIYSVDSELIISVWHSSVSQYSISVELKDFLILTPGSYVPKFAGAKSIALNSFPQY